MRKREWIAYSIKERTGVTSGISISLSACAPPQEAVYTVMAAREREEEQTQRTMIALNETKPSYPGKSSEDVQRVLEEVRHTEHASTHMRM